MQKGSQMNICVRRNFQHKKIKIVVYKQKVLINNRNFCKCDEVLRLDNSHLDIKKMCAQSIEL